jgi:hypothetical protein
VGAAWGALAAAEVAVYEATEAGLRVAHEAAAAVYDAALEQWEAEAAARKLAADAAGVA